MESADHQEELDPFGTGKLPSGRHGLPREAVVRSQRERMVEAMITVVANKGYAETTVADIISAAGVSRATFYEQFTDKEDCFIAAYGTVMGRMLEYVAEGFTERRSGEWIDQIRGAIGALLTYFATNPVAARVGIVEGFGAGARARDRYQQAVSSFFPFMDAARAGSPDPERIPPKTARMGVGALSTLMFDEAAAGRADELPARLPEMVYMVVSLYLGREKAREAMKETTRQLEEARVVKATASTSEHPGSDGTK
ncbi:MAG: TetR/AcrR family transcriptional regulator [Solirubrobacterales bacterium]|nr:TetR/AcrR family transcriptional regulator [Solirubrobacterales bacterium]